MIERLNGLEGLHGRPQNYDALMEHPQAIRYVAEFMHQTGLLQQFSFAFIREEEEGTAPELSTLREGLELEAKDDI